MGDYKMIEAADNDDKKDDDSDGLNADKVDDGKSKDSFAVANQDKNKEDNEETGAGSKAECEKSLAENTEAAEKLDIVEGMAIDDDVNGEASIFQHVEKIKESDKTAIDKASEKER